MKKMINYGRLAYDEALRNKKKIDEILQKIQKIEEEIQQILIKIQFKKSKF
ncbi:MAG: hypothetical protein JW870_11075 [Candidatus Delongbacteria bacterium]|nr:hypothetical protein [Candidatus Delongbacteria bacterium]